MKQVLDEKTKEGIKLISNILKDIGEKKITTAITLMKDSKIGDADLMEVLGLGTSNSAAYYRKELEKEGVIKGYSAEIDWGKLGCPVQFTIIVESDTHEILLEMEEAQTLSLKRYNTSFGDVCIIPTAGGGVVLEEISFCFGSKAIAIIKGRATSEHDVVVYSRYNLIDKYAGIKTTITILKNSIIKNFIIDRGSLDVLSKVKTHRVDELKVSKDNKLIKAVEDFFG